VSSDTSTEVGESEAEDEKGGSPQMLPAGRQLALRPGEKGRLPRSSAKEGVGTSP